MDNEAAEQKFQDLQKYINFLEKFLLQSRAQPKNVAVAQKLEKAEILLQMLKAGYRKYVHRIFYFTLIGFVYAFFFLFHINSKSYIKF